MNYLGGVLAAVLLLSSCQQAPIGPTQHESVHFDLDNSEVLHLNLKMGAGELHVDGGSKYLADADFTYNIAAWKPLVSYHSTGSRGDLDISQPDGPTALGDVDYRWDVRLNDRRQTDIVAKLGAGSVRMNLATLPLRSVEVSMGAGELKMDLRGNPAKSYDVRIQGGVGSATIYLPKSVGISATAQGGIGSIDVDGLEERNGRWVNPSQLDSPVTIRLDVKGGVGEIKLIAE
ncbi:MAG: hypothetical protein RL328_932 [Acidobacteriota bacterium]|jgi:hypothetical protein